MIAALRFGTARPENGRMLRPAVFGLRSTLPLSAASVVANGVRETLVRLLGRECEVELLEPIVPGPEERRVLAAEGLVWRVRGRRADGFVILRPVDAARLAGLAFGEPERPATAPLSELERETLDRLFAALVPLCTSLCGTLGPAVRIRGDVAAAEVASYFEVRTLALPRIAVGFGMSVDPPEKAGSALTLDDLGDVEVAGSVRFASGALALPHFARLGRGAVVPLDTHLNAPAFLCVGGVRIARGDAGASGGSRAFAVAASGAA
jgi:flagellar motor switch/type III secretory pathway protein FliN